MIAVMVSDKTYTLLQEMNQYERYEFYRIKATEQNAILNELEQLAEYSHAIVELAALNDLVTDDLLNGLTAKACVILLATELSPYDVVVRDFYGKGITDVITTSGTPMLKEINDRLLKDGAQSSTARFPSDTPTPPLPDTEKRTEAPPTHSRPAISNQRAYTIAFAGAGNRIGTSTQVFQTALFLKSMYHTVAIIDMSDSGWLADCADEPGIRMEDGYYLVHGIPYYTTNRAISILLRKYTHLVFDYGNFCEIRDIVSFTEKDTHSVVCGYKPWERNYLNSVFENDDGTIQYIFSFVPTSLEPTILLAMKECDRRTYFAPYTPDNWKYCGADHIYQALTKTPSSLRPTSRKNIFTSLFERKGGAAL